MNGAIDGRELDLGVVVILGSGFGELRLGLLAMAAPGEKSVLK